MTDYMLTVIGAGPRDIQVNNAYSIMEAIALAERVTGAPVDHGRGGIGSNWFPALIIDAITGDVEQMHDRPALESMTYANPAHPVSVPRGS